MFRILNEKSTKKPYEDMVRGRNKSLPNKDETRNGYRVRETANEYAKRLQSTRNGYRVRALQQFSEITKTLLI